MCGIAGFVDTRGGIASHVPVERMTDASGTEGRMRTVFQGPLGRPWPPSPEHHRCVHRGQYSELSYARTVS